MATPTPGTYPGSGYAAQPTAGGPQQQHQQQQNHPYPAAAGSQGPGGPQYGPPAPSQQPFDKFCVIHIATTCDEHGVYVTKDSAEVIEIGWVVVDARDPSLPEVWRCFYCRWRMA